KKELVDETTALAKKYGIATPYTSYLIMPDAPVPVAGGGRGMGPAGAPGAGFGGGSGGVPAGLYYLGRNGAGKNEPEKVSEFAKKAQSKPGELAENRGKFEDKLRGGLQAPESDSKATPELRQQLQAKEQKDAFDRARSAIAARRYAEVQGGKLGVD